MVKLRILWSLVFLSIAGTGIEQGENLLLIVLLIILAALPASEKIINGFREILEVYKGNII